MKYYFIDNRKKMKKKKKKKFVPSWQCYSGITAPKAFVRR